MASLTRFERTRSKSEQQIPRQPSPASPQQPAKAKARRASMLDSLWSLASTLPGVSSGRTRSCVVVAPIKPPSPSQPTVLRAARSVTPPTIECIEHENVKGVSVRCAEREGCITIQLPSVRLAFLHDKSPTPEDCRESRSESEDVGEAYEDDLFRGRRRSIADLAGMMAWLNDSEAREI
ncbi:hypothetical protein T484DRAFT_1922672 [Baffinella frigidus]|nr:hypothetical protein T484DRAFT_1922672 [Cryptophyta sp. CCMP2293]